MNHPSSSTHFAKRSLGQNFLTGAHYPERIVRAVAPRADETILEIGPGRGALTSLLLQSGARVIAVEMDDELIEPLRARFAAAENFQIIHTDALKADFCQLLATHCPQHQTARVVANLPYNVATPILQRLIAQRHCLTELTLMFQREVVERITASPGGKEYGYLSMLVQFYCETHKLFDVPPTVFRPVPKVVSSVVRLKIRPSPLASVSNEQYFLQVVSAIFAQRRKTIMNNLRAGRSRLRLNEGVELAAPLQQAGIDPQRRAETLTIIEAAKLAEELRRVTNSS